MKAQLCPKCNGEGMLPYKPWTDDLQIQMINRQSTWPYLCDNCQGAKVIYVPGLTTLPETQNRR